MEYEIPFNKPYLAGRELLYVAQSVLQGHISGNGSFTRRCERWIEERLGAPRVLLTPSGTAALEMTALLLDLAPGDEVVLPAFTFVTTATAYALRGARPVFVDVREDTLNLDERALERALGPRTRAIVVVHYGGVSCEMEAILAAAAARGIAVIEDAAHGFGASWRGRPLGTLGALGAFSFHETKNISSGEGGALVVNDPALVARAEVLREKGTDRARFYRGEVDRYTWQDLGSSWVMSDMLAGYLYGQLEHLDEINGRRRDVWARYHEELAPLEEQGLLRRPRVPADCEPNGHLYYLLLRSLDERARLIQHLRRRRILAVFHYVPLHTSPAGRRLAGDPPALPVTEDVADRLLRLPLYYELTADLQGRVIAAVREFFAAEV